MRKERKEMKKSKTGSTNGFRIIHDTGVCELPSQKAKTASKMFQFKKMKKRGRK